MTVPKTAKIILGTVAAIGIIAAMNGGDDLASKNLHASNVSATSQDSKPGTASSKPKSPVITKKNSTETEAVPYTEATVKDEAIDAGVTVVRTAGAYGVRTKTYQTTITDGIAGEKALVKDEITLQPVTQVTARGTKKPPASSCDSNYTGCVPIASDVDCAGGSGNGPAYVRGPVRVIGNDIYRLDFDHDGYGCE